MTTPNTPSTSKAGDGVPSSALKASLDALAKKLSFQETPTGRNNGGIYGNGSSLPTTPAKLNGELSNYHSSPCFFFFINNNI